MTGTNKWVVEYGKEFDNLQTWILSLGEAPTVSSYEFYYLKMRTAMLLW